MAFFNLYINVIYNMDRYISLFILIEEKIEIPNKNEEQCWNVKIMVAKKNWRVEIFTKVLLKKLKVSSPCE